MPFVLTNERSRLQRFLASLRAQGAGPNSSRTVSWAFSRRSSLAQIVLTKAWTPRRELARGRLRAGSRVNMAPMGHTRGRPAVARSPFRSSRGEPGDVRRQSPLDVLRGRPLGADVAVGGVQARDTAPRTVDRRDGFRPAGQNRARVCVTPAGGATSSLSLWRENRGDAWLSREVMCTRRLRKEGKKETARCKKTFDDKRSWISYFSYQCHVRSAHPASRVAVPATRSGETFASSTVRDASTSATRSWYRSSR